MLAIIQVYVSPVVGGVFAVVLYAFFITGIITGAFFPEFKGLNEPYSGVADLFGNLSPDNRLDAAKALVWAFVAG
ncbi:MAG: hypothetical protein GWO08_10025, partial [Gammaproteobacteria bacterium]|nr:hypothetical protein [Gammaproteobacteria bacterium]